MKKTLIKKLIKSLIATALISSSFSVFAWPFSSNNAGYVNASDFNNGNIKGFDIGAVQSEYNKNYMDEIKTTGANVVRLIVPFEFCTPVNDQMPCIYHVSDENIKKVENASKVFGQNKIKVIVSAYFYQKSKGDFWKNKMLQTGMSDAWKKFAEQISNDKNIAALDLYYAPDEAGMVNPYKISQLWSVAGYNLIKSIRTVDKHHAIIFQVPDGSPDNIKNLQNMDDDDLVYGFDMFYPNQITLQGISSQYSNVLPYPLGAEYNIDTDHSGSAKIINKDALQEYLKPIYDFKQASHNVFISSWGIVHYAPDGSAYRYINDVLSIFDQYKLSWAYYGFRINKNMDPFIFGTDINDTARSPESPLISSLRDNMKNIKKSK